MPQRKRTRAKKATSNAQVNSLAKAVKQLTVAKKSKPKPFRDTGGIIGNRVGGMFGNATIGKGIGRWLGTGIGSIFGSGDYTLAGSQPSYNVMMNGAQIPKFSSTRQTNIVCHREYLGDILGTAAFTNTVYPLNPGIRTTFPWLSTVAANYQEYKFHGLVFEFRSLITDFVTGGSPGVVVMATNYNADAPTYTTKQQMENSEFAVATKPTTNLMHGVECADNQTILPQRYVRQGNVPTGQDLRLYDTGNFQFATSSNPVQNLGELWVSYCVEFFKPLQATVTAVPGIGEHAVRSGVSNVAPLGSTSTYQLGGLDVTINSVQIAIANADPNIRYKIDVYWTGTSALSYVPPVLNFSGCNVVGFYNGGAGVAFVAPQSGAVNVANAAISFVLESSLNVSGTIIVGFGVAGTLPINPIVDIFVTQVDPSVTN
jgi:hypothetical protein